MRALLHVSSVRCFVALRTDSLKGWRIGWRVGWRGHIVNCSRSRILRRVLRERHADKGEEASGSNENGGEDGQVAKVASEEAAFRHADDGGEVVYSHLPHCAHVRDEVKL